MRAEEFAGIGGRDTGSDWLDLTPQPLFYSIEVMQSFPIEEGPSEVEAAPAKPAELPAWLNPYQLVAWARYRDLSIVAKVGNWNGLAGQNIYGGETKIGSRKDVEAALEEGRLVAQGYPKNGASFAPIPAVEWSRIALAPLELSRQHPYERIQFNRQDVLALFPAIGSENIRDDPPEPATFASERAPAVKAGRPPSDDEILAKADEMKARGMDGRTIAKDMRLEPGFQNVATTAVRELIKGRWKPGGRPKKSA